MAFPLTEREVHTSVVLASKQGYDTAPFAGDEAEREAAFLEQVQQLQTRSGYTTMSGGQLGLLQHRFGQEFVQQKLDDGTIVSSK